MREEFLQRTYVTKAGMLQLTETEDQGAWLYSTEDHTQIKVKTEDLIQLAEFLKAARVR